MLNNNAKGVWIRRELCDDTNLSWTEKVLLAQVDALDNDDAKGCFASAAHFAAILNLKEGSVRNMLSDLRSRGYIKELWSDGHSRGLRASYPNAIRWTNDEDNCHKLVTDNRNKRMTEPSQENDRTVTNKCREPSRKNVHNNKENNKREHEAMEVFSFWVETFGKSSSTIFGTKRKRAVLNRLKGGYEVEQLKDAIRGCKASPYHQGHNSRGTVYDDLELICRDETKVDNFIGIWIKSGLATSDTSKGTQLCKHCIHNGGMIYDDFGSLKKCLHENVLTQRVVAEPEEASVTHIKHGDEFDPVLLEGTF